MAVSGSYAFVADGHAGLQVMDISNPADPRWTGAWDTDGFAGGVAVSGNHAYVADEGYGLQVISIRIPAFPEWVGSLDTSGFAQRVAVAGSHVCIADGSGGLQVIHVSNPATPRRIGRNSSYATSGVGVEAGKIYATAGAEGLILFDLITEPIEYTAMEYRPGTGFVLWISGTPGLEVRLQRSGNLTNWMDWQTLTFGTTPRQVVDGDASTAPPRFYRAVPP